MEDPNEVFIAAMVADLVSSLSADCHEEYDERAGIMTHDGQLPRVQAECLALLCVLNRHPLALTGVSGIWVELQGQTGILFTTDIAYARQHIERLGGRELQPVDLRDVVEEQYGGLLFLRPWKVDG